jgi:sugar phosphate isomerase/epimerase
VPREVKNRIGCTLGLPPRDGRPLRDHFKHAQKCGYETVELGVSQREDFRPVLAKILASNAAEIREQEKEHGLRVTGTMYIANMFHPDPNQRKTIYDTVRSTILLAEMLEAPICVTNPAYETPDISLEEVWAGFLDDFAALVDFAAARDVKLAVETTRHMDRPCIVYNVPTFRRLFEAIPSRNLGVNLDPSHFVWMGIDIYRFIRTFGEKIFGAHAKDTEILREILGDLGIVDGYRMTWWRFRTPGFGEIDWHRFVSALSDVGYKGDIHVEPEDPIFPRDEALEKAAAFLKPIVG